MRRSLRDLLDRTLSTLALAPLAGSNGVGDLDHELTYAQNHAGLRLVPGTETFSPVLRPAAATSPGSQQGAPGPARGSGRIRDRTVTTPSVRPSAAAG